MNIITNKIITPCGHHFCYLCLLKWVNTLKINRYRMIIDSKIEITFPVCRQSIENVLIKRYKHAKIRIMIKI